MNKAIKDPFVELQHLLGLAVKLELFTIPFYLYTFYSLKNPKSHAGLRLKEVILEEMLHMAIISNIMHALKGCKPPAYSPIRDLENGRPYTEELVRKYVPFYPSWAPIYKSKDEPSITGEDDIRRFVEDIEKPQILNLDSLSIEQIVAFLRLELPELRENTDVDGWQTIGEFYNYVKRQFLRCKKLEFDSVKQIELYTHNPTKERNTMRPIQNLKDALDYIDLIVEQGEGATFYNLAKYDEKFRHQKIAFSTTTFAENAFLETEVKKTELSHFYHFLMVYELMGGLEKFTIETQSFDEDAFKNNVDKALYIEFRENNVINLVKNPAAKSDLYPDEAKENNFLFNSNYSDLLDRLTYASLDDHRLNFGIALAQMSRFDELAIKVTKHEFPMQPGENTQSFCGPSFEYIRSDLRRR